LHIEQNVYKLQAKHELGQDKHEVAVLLKYPSGQLDKQVLLKNIGYNELELQEIQISLLEQLKQIFWHCEQLLFVVLIN
jgi:hypothetical protein